jgi:hypothetical protein
VSVTQGLAGPARQVTPFFFPPLDGGAFEFGSLLFLQFRRLRERGNAAALLLRFAFPSLGVSVI